MKKRIFIIILIIILVSGAVYLGMNWSNIKDKNKKETKVTDAIKFKEEYEN